MLQFEDLYNICYEGQLLKQSRFLKKWHKRWVVLTHSTLYTYKEEKNYWNPTEVINLNQIVTITTVEKEEINQLNAFKITTHDCTFYLIAQSLEDRERWIGKIGKEMVQQRK